MVQKRNITVKALARADMILILSATLLTSEAKREKKRPRIINMGAPGGWPTSSLNAVAINSPQSHKLSVGSTVKI
jgi:hypothetical protein